MSTLTLEYEILDKNKVSIEIGHIVINRWFVNTIHVVREWQIIHWLEDIDKLNNPSKYLEVVFISKKEDRDKIKDSDLHITEEVKDILEKYSELKSKL